MGCDYDARAVIGVRADKLYSEKKEKSSVTKYDENTGKPYQKEVINTRFFWCDKEIDEPNCLDEDFFKDMCGLGLFTSGDGGIEIVGLQVGDEVDPGDVASIDGATISKAWTDVKAALEKSGYKGNDIKLHVILWVGC